MKIAVTDPGRDARNLENYLVWLRRWMPALDPVVLGPADNGAALVRECAGLVLTGGGDVDPRWYGRDDARSLVRGVVEQRDRMEFDAIRTAGDLGLPVLGVCRGAQVFAVARGGSLFPDVEASGHPSHARKQDGSERRHGIRLVSGSLLHQCTKRLAGDVNSYHHQAVSRPGTGLRVTAWSDDGLPEAMERVEGRRPFLLLVQWHPERNADPDDPFARAVALAFGEAVQQR